jgi:Na+-driven multidrug efflux pump
LKYAKYGAGLLIGAAVLSLLFLMFAPWRSIFTSDEKVEQDLLSLTPFLIVFMILDCVQAFISSISRAVG